MSWIVFALGFILIGLGLWSGQMALNLLPTDLGLFYAVAFALAGCSGVITLAIGALIRRVDALGKRLAAGRAVEVVNLVEAPLADADASEYETPSEEAPSVETPLPAQSDANVVGRYSANGVDYTMYSDGSIEAITPAGVTKFATMTELREAMARRPTPIAEAS
jgi:hypothetical protein